VRDLFIGCSYATRRNPLLTQISIVDDRAFIGEDRSTLTLTLTSISLGHDPLA
jgi:hypothetical protein